MSVEWGGQIVVIPAQWCSDWSVSLPKLSQLCTGGSDWVPAHIGIPQNEQADEGARAAATSDVLIRNPRVHYRDYYPIIRRMIYVRWEQIWRDVTDNKLRSIKTTVKPWSSSSQRNRRLEVMLCRLRIGHTRMTHKWILEGNQAPLCEHCTEPLTVKHVLTECDLYTHLRN